MLATCEFIDTLALRSPDVFRYHVPSHLRDHIDFISPGTESSIRLEPRQNRFPKRESQSCSPPPDLKNLTLQDCLQLGVYPACVNALYNIPDSRTYAANNTFSIFAFGGSYLQSDMDQFFAQIAPEVPVGTTADNVLLNGVQLTTNFSDPLQHAPTEEANLDFQLAWPLVYPQNITLFNSLPSKLQIVDIAKSQNTTVPTSLTNLTAAEVNIALVYGLDDVFSAFDGVSSAPYDTIID